jgi:hypothetical protein
MPPTRTAADPRGWRGDARAARLHWRPAMPIEIVVNDSFENVENAVKASLADCGCAVSQPPMSAGVEVKTRMRFWIGEKGNKLLAQFVPFLWKVEMISSVITAYQDGTVAVTVREGSTFGGNLAQGVVGAATGGWVGSAAAYASDQAGKAQALSRLLAEVDAKLRERLAGRIAYEGPVRPDVAPVMA